MNFENKKYSSGMTKSNILIISALALMIIGGVYFFIKNKNYINSNSVGDDGASKLKNIVRREVEVSDLFKAKQKVGTELTRLSTLKKRSEYERYLIDQISKEYEGTYSRVLAKTDQMLKTVSADVAIKAQVPSAITQLNDKRKKIEDALKAWNTTKALIAKASKTNPPPSLAKLIQDAKDNLNEIKQYIVELDSLVDGLTPQGGLTQAEIDAYNALVANALTEANSAVVDVTTIVDSNSTVSTNTQDDTSTETSSSDSTDDTPIVTAEDIETQEEVVEQAEAELEEALDQATEDSVVDWTTATSGSSLPDDVGDIGSSEEDDSGAVELIQGTNRE